MSVSRFKQFNKDNSFDIEIFESAEPTKTAAQAAEVHNVPVVAIVKSILVTGDQHFFLFLVSGDKRLDLTEAEKIAGVNNIRLATPDEVKTITGYPIGGVPPFGHSKPLKTFFV